MAIYASLQKRKSEVFCENKAQNDIVERKAKTDSEILTCFWLADKLENHVCIPLVRLFSNAL